jgi:6-pyruvoyl-tetrahydropterin synthase-like protein
MEPDLSRQRIITLAVVAGAVLFVFLQLQPGVLFKDTTPTGSDLGGHVWEPNYLREHLLPQGRLTGWAPDWHAGVPTLVFYFPFPALVIALLSVVLPYTITFKLVLALALMSVPVAAWAFGRLSGLRFPAPALMAVATVPFLFDHFHPQTRGGDVISTLRGEYAFAVGLPLALLFIGVLARALDTRRYRAGAAVLLGLVVLSHVFATLFALAGAAVLLLVRPSRRRLLDAAFVVVVGGLLAGFWLIPLRWRYGYAPPGLHDHVGQYLQNLFPFASRCATRGQCQPGQFLPVETWHLGVVTLLAGAGVVISARRRARMGLAIGALAASMAIGFVVLPGGRLQNDRLLPFWFLGLYLLAALGIAEGGHEIQAWRERRRRRARYASPGGAGPAVPAIAPIAGLVLVVLLVGLPLRSVPGWLPIHTVDRSKVRLTMDFAFGGYEGRPGWGEYHRLMTTIDDVGRDHGCGRAFAEADRPSLSKYGTLVAFMLLPYWSDGCISTVNEGLEVSETSLYEQLVKVELSKAPNINLYDLPYENLVVNKGVEHLQLMGVRYYLAVSPETKAQADANPDLVRRARSGPWSVYEVKRSVLVTPLAFEPVVIEGEYASGQQWSQVGVNFFQRDKRGREVPFAAGGPDGWARVRVGEHEPTANVFNLPAIGTSVTVDAPRTPVAAARVSRIRKSDDRISFDVDRTGSPVLVKTSYFPNWTASGARGPWRVTPNFMVVVPTARHVTLHYGWTPVDLFGFALTLAGIAGVVGLAWRGRRRAGEAVPVTPTPAPAPAPAQRARPARPAASKSAREAGPRTQSQRKKRKRAGRPRR